MSPSTQNPQALPYNYYRILITWFFRTLHLITTDYLFSHKIGFHTTVPIDVGFVNVPSMTTIFISLSPSTFVFSYSCFNIILFLKVHFLECSLDIISSSKLLVSCTKVGSQDNLWASTFPTCLLGTIENKLTCLNFSFLLCKMGVIIFPHRNTVRVKW